MSEDAIREQRADIEAEIAGQTLCERLMRTARDHADKPAYSARAAGGGWDTMTWGEVRRRVLEIAAGFHAVGLEQGDTVALMMSNRPEHVLCDLGAVHARGLPTTVYATLAADQIRFVAGNCSARFAVLEGAGELDRWRQIRDELPRLEKIIVLDPAACPDEEGFLTYDAFLGLGRDRLAADPDAVERTWRAAGPDEPVALLYTSGTTGDPKGVPLTHGNIMFEVVATDRMINLPEFATQISYLPYAHIAERVLSLYFPVCNVSHVYFCPDATQLLPTLQDVHPMTFFGVPRVWEKFQAGLLAILSTQPEEQQTKVREAMAAGLAYIEACQLGRTPTEEQQAAFAAADGAILGLVRSLIGLDKASWLASAAAPMPLEVQRFFAGLGMRVLDVYGMTETTGAFTANSPDRFKLGTVGPPIPGVEVRVAEDGEILSRGPGNTAGYLNRPSATRDLIDDEGWLHTGDVGSIDEDGFVKIVDRKKELIITAGGENISPANIENLLKEHPLVGQALAYGDLRPYPVALLTLDGEMAPAWAKSHGIEATDLAAIAEHPVVQAEIEQAVAAANSRLARVQQVKRWRLLPVEWTAESEELTPTLKLKRRVVNAKYADVIDSMYAD